MFGSTREEEILPMRRFVICADQLMFGRANEVGRDERGHVSI
jgi:hypothetical protein